MFGIGIPELIVIMVIALIVIGPEKLPEIAKTLGKAFSEFKNVVDGVKTTMQEEQRNIEKNLDLKPAQSYKMSLGDKEEELKKDYEEALGEEEKVPSASKASGKTTNKRVSKGSTKISGNVSGNSSRKASAGATEKTSAKKKATTPERPKARKVNKAQETVKEV